MTTEAGGASAYGELESRFRRYALIAEAAGVLHWDMSVVMPPGGAAARAEQLATLRVVAHEALSDSRLAGLLDEAEGRPESLDTWRAANLREMRRLWRHATALPADLVAALSRATSACETMWRTARAESDFAGLAPYLGDVVSLTRETAQAKAAALDLPAYDSLMDEYEPGADSVRIAALFEDYAAMLPELLDAVLARQAARPDPPAPAGPFAIEDQRRLCRAMAETVGLDFATARLDESLHPFSGGVAEDSRITTRYDEADFAQALMGVLHESGHAMYERGLPGEWRYQPVGQARGMVLHESQSLLIEMQICRGHEFIEWAAPVIAGTLGLSGPALEAGNLLCRAIRVEAGFIRVDADEVTYPAHIILRTRLEQALIADQLKVADLPAAWNEGMTGLLGITPPDDRRGCLQDIHWPGGDFGYFPTYTLGAMAAAQLAQAARRAGPDIMPAIARGEFGPLMDWLRTNVHARASLTSTDEVLRQATGRPLDASAFKSHLRNRYLGET